MKLFLYIILLFCGFTIKVNSQNLVVNPSFEDTVLCALAPDPMRQCVPWFTPSSGSPDYFNNTVTNIQGGCVGVWGAPGYQMAKTGNSLCGLSVYDSGHTFPFREYLEGFLSDTLEAKHTYCVSFYVNLANTSMLAADRIGAYFSVDSVVDYNTATMLPYIPQVQNTGGVITDTLNWVLVSGSFEAQGGERFITIGNFYTDSNTMVLPVQGGMYNFAYYYIDDVSVEDCTVGIEELEKDYRVNEWPNPAQDEVWFSLTKDNMKMETVEVVNVLGEIVLRLDDMRGENKIDVRDLGSGMYFLKVKTRDCYYTQKFLKE